MNFIVNPKPGAIGICDCSSEIIVIASISINSALDHLY